MILSQQTVADCFGLCFYWAYIFVQSVFIRVVLLQIKKVRVSQLQMKRGCYIIHGNHNKKKYADQFVSMEIIQLDDQELTLYWYVLP